PGRARRHLRLGPARLPRARDRSRSRHRHGPRVRGPGGPDGGWCPRLGTGRSRRLPVLELLRPVLLLLAGLSARCDSGRLFGWVEGGVGLDGGQAERVRVPMADATLCSIPEDLAPEAALLLCDVLPTGHFCAALARVVADGTYAVIG